MKTFISQGVLPTREVELLKKDIEMYSRDKVNALITNGDVTKGGNYDPNIRECQIHMVDYSKFPVTTQILQSLIIENYKSIYQHLDYSSLSHFQYVHYAEGGFFKKHQDVVPAVDVTRVLTMSINMSDSEDYDGGDLLIYDGDSVVGRCEREKGSFVIFPAFMQHEATLVTHGSREAIVTWLNNKHNVLNTFKAHVMDHSHKES
jgi:predicted 2-oxoglutarate/Fe(II)-dependent dioxygenase YbiX